MLVYYTIVLLNISMDMPSLQNRSNCTGGKLHSALFFMIKHLVFSPGYGIGIASPKAGRMDHVAQAMPIEDAKALHLVSDHYNEKGRRRSSREF